MSKQASKNFKAKHKGKAKNNKSHDMGQGPTICLFVEHDCPEMSHSLYVIPLPLDLSDHSLIIDSHGFMAGSKRISPALTFSEEKSFLPYAASVNLGSKIYFFGGTTLHLEERTSVLENLGYKVWVFDVDHPEKKMQCVAPMNAPKESPCVFVADGMIYALGTPVWSCDKKLPGFQDTGFFERYDPVSDHWEVLPDPPLFHRWEGVELLDGATMVGRRVFIGSRYFHAIFNLDKLVWDPLPHPKLFDGFPYGALFIEDTASLYHLCGQGVWKPGTSSVSEACFSGPSLAVKRVPLTTYKEGDYASSLDKCPSLISGKEQVMAQLTDLDENKSFTQKCYSPWRDLFHVGGRFFCYVVTAQLLDWDYHTHTEPNSRGIWIKFFEEVGVPTDNRNGGDKSSYEKTIFRPVASFCYKIDTNFFNLSTFVRCSILGNVPDSWTNVQLKRKEESKLKPTNKEMEVLNMVSITHCQSLVMKTDGGKCDMEETRHHELENYARKFGYYDVDELFAAHEARISLLEAELAKKSELLKAYESIVAKGGDMVRLSV